MEQPPENQGGWGELTVATRRPITAARDAGLGYIRLIHEDLAEALANKDRIEACVRSMFEIAEEAAKSDKPRIRLSAARLFAVYLRLCIEVVKIEARALPAVCPAPNTRVSRYQVAVSPAQQAQLDRLRRLIEGKFEDS